MEGSQEVSNDMMEFWMKFFKDAGILNSDVENYSVSFVNHRIQKNMLMDLNKEYLVEMGITAMGDIIAILKQAKLIQTKPLREAAQTTMSSYRNSPVFDPEETPLAKLEKSISSSLSASSTTRKSIRRSTPASRMVDHYLANEPGARLMSETAPQNSSASEDLESSPKTSVFNRLGLNSPPGKTNSAHSRLGFLGKKTSNIQVTLKSSADTATPSKKSDLREVLKRPATTTCHDADDSQSDSSECEYMGVLKKSNVPKKKLKLSKSKTKSPEISSAPLRTEGIFGASARAEQLSAKQRLGKKTTAKS